MRTKILLVLAIFLAALFWLGKISDISGIIPFFLPKKEKIALIKYFPFSSKDSLKEWKEKVLHRRVDYRIETSGDKSYVRAISNSTCSAMYYKIKLDANKHPFLSWKWRINSFPDKKFLDDPLSKEEDDFAARMYVMFPALFFSNTKVLEYVWAKDLELGTTSSSPYSDNIKIIVAESGPNEGDGWILEERDIYQDYLSAFKTKPRLKIGAVAFMCDSDSTNSSAEAFFDEIKLFYK